MVIRGKDQSYFNTKELVDNVWCRPDPFRVVDSRIGLDVDGCEVSWCLFLQDRWILFLYECVWKCGAEYTREELDGQLKAEFISALQPAFGRLSSWRCVRIRS